MAQDIAPMVVMGVSGSGKSTIGQMLAQELDGQFIDGDALHPQANREKMATGQPLDDQDRAPWLEIIGKKLAAGSSTGRPLIIACSALKRSYRDLIRDHEPAARFIHLVGSKELIRGRMESREHEFMPPSLLTSQMSTLEEPAEEEHAIRVDISKTPQEIIDSVLGQLGIDAQ